MRLLLIEDNPDDALLVKEALAEVPGIPLEVEWVDRLSLGFERLNAGGIDVVLMDLNLPDSGNRGLGTLSRLRAHAPNLPIVVMTGAYEDEKFALEALENGAQDYVIKGEIGNRMLWRVVRYAIERKRLERKIQEAMAVKLEFTSMVSHELRTPLTVIKEGIGIVLDGSMGPIKPEQQEYLKAAQNNVNRLARLINDVLDYQKLEAGQMELRSEPNDLNAVALEVVKGFAALGEQKGLKVVSDLAQGLPRIPFDKDKITQVLVNFLSNAIKFSRKGAITLRTERLDNAIRVSVQDEGIGVRSQDLPKLFQNFSQIPIEGARKTGGTGLGLAICKKIVELHRGRIGVDSVYGKGSTLWFLLPIAERRR